jgi:hypothetical protein
MPNLLEITSIILNMKRAVVRADMTAPLCVLVMHYTLKHVVAETGRKSARTPAGAVFPSSRSHTLASALEADK